MEKIKLKKTYNSSLEVAHKFLLVLKAINGLKIGDKDLMILSYFLIGHNPKNINSKEKILKEQKLKDNSLYAVLSRLRKVGLLEHDSSGKNILVEPLRKIDLTKGEVYIEMLFQKGGVDGE